MKEFEKWFDKELKKANSNGYSLWSAERREGWKAALMWAKTTLCIDSGSIEIIDEELSGG